MVSKYQRIIDHFTDQSQAQVFLGFDARGKSLLSEPMASPLSFAHDDDTDHSGPMQRGCDSCFLIHGARALMGNMPKKARTSLVKEMKAALARFGDENPEATADILEILK